jgi:hypothetical protein
MRFGCGKEYAVRVKLTLLQRTATRMRTNASFVANLLLQRGMFVDHAATIFVLRSIF